MQRKRYIPPHPRWQINTSMCRYYNSPQGCKYGTRCRFSHQTFSSPNKTHWNQNNSYNTVCDMQSLRTLLTFFVSPKYKLHAPEENISSIINKHKSNQHFMEIICSDTVQLMHIQLGQTAETSSHVVNVLKFAIEIITQLDAKYISQQKNWFNITMYLCKTLNNYLSLPSIIAHLFAHLNDTLYCDDTISYLLRIVKEIMTLNPKLQIPLVFIKNVHFNSHFASGYSHEILLKYFPGPKMLTRIFNACNFGQILPFDTNLIETKKTLTSQQKIDHLSSLYLDSSGYYDYGISPDRLAYFKLHPNYIPSWIVKIMEKSLLGNDKHCYVTSPTGIRNHSQHVTIKFRDTIHRTMPLHWIIISIRVFRDIYWNNIQNIIQNVIKNDDDNGSNVVDDIYSNNNTNVWNLDVMHVIVDYVGDNNSLSELEKYKLFEFDELNDIYGVVQCLKLLSKNMDINTENVFYKANGKSIKEWLNYFVKHRNYKCVPKTQNELMNCNFFANRAISK